MSTPDFPYQAEADLPGVPFSSIRPALLRQAETAGLALLVDDADRLTVQTAHGLIGLRPGRATEVAAMVAAEDPRWLFAIKNTVLSHVRRLMPEVADAMRWTDGDVEGTAPPNFQFVRVSAVQALGPVFLRVTLQGEDLSSYGDESIHFRLLQPPKGARATWPTLAANGSTRWPDGPGAPHRPIYTARTVDRRTHTLVTDIYLHDGGRTSEWAQELARGETHRQDVAIVGPSGGGLLRAPHVLLASDETGFPAAARLLESLPPEATGEVILEAEEGAACAYPMPALPGIRLQWLRRSDGERLLDAARDALARRAGANVWFAGEREDARQLREDAKAKGWGPKALRISAFWRRTPAQT